MLDNSLNQLFKNLKVLDSQRYDIRYENFIEEYRLKILKDRNLLAHAETNGKRNFEAKDKNGRIIVYDPDKCNEIRGNINKYSQLFEDTLSMWD